MEKQLFMVPTPTKFFLVKGSAEGYSELNAFDNALLKAGIGNTNLIRLSSIIPPKCQEIEPVSLPYGALIPTAYASISSSVPGELIASAIAVAIPQSPELPGVIMEHSAKKSLKEVQEEVTKMAEKALEFRNFAIKEIKSQGCEWIVKTVGATFAAAILWY